MRDENNIVAFAFNAGYWLRKYMPKLYGSLSKGIQTEGDFLDGFMSGGKEMEKEIEFKEMGDLRENERNIERNI